MSQQDQQQLTPWLYRRWRFDFPVSLFPAVRSRLRGAPSRVAEMVREARPCDFTEAFGRGWSIQRHVGHLADLDRLLNSRLDAYEAGVHVLPAADMQNQMTLDTDHDARSIEDIVETFRDARTATMFRLDGYSPDFYGRTAFHERLGVQKRVVDTCVFFADHDDHHLALIEEWLQRRTATECQVQRTM